MDRLAGQRLKYRLVGVRLSEYQLAQLDDIAKHIGISRVALIRDAVEQYLLSAKNQDSFEFIAANQVPRPRGRPRKESDE